MRFLPSHIFRSNKNLSYPHGLLVFLTLATTFYSIREQLYLVEITKTPASPTSSLVGKDYLQRLDSLRVSPAHLITGTTTARPGVSHISTTVRTYSHQAKLSGKLQIIAPHPLLYAEQRAKYLEVPKLGTRDSQVNLTHLVGASRRASHS
jgi:hypothetical protein